MGPSTWDWEEEEDFSCMLLNLNNIKVLAIQKLIFKYNEKRNQISYKLDNAYKGNIAVFNKWWLLLSFSTPTMSYSYLDF